MQGGEKLPEAAEMRAEKKALRKSVQLVLRAISDNDAKRASQKILERLGTIPAVAHAKAVSAYLSMPKGEVQTGALVQWLFEKPGETRIFVPTVVGARSEDMRMPELVSFEELGGLTLSKWGIPEFSTEQLSDPSRADAGLFTGGPSIVDSPLIDLVLVPGVAFTEKCERLGHGKGYYDSFLTRLQSARAANGLPPAFLLGIGFDEQLVQSVPCESHDVVLDAIVTPTKLITRA